MNGENVVAVKGGQLVIPGPANAQELERIAISWDRAVIREATVLLGGGMKFIPDGTCPHCGRGVKVSTIPEGTVLLSRETADDEEARTIASRTEPLALGEFIMALEAVPPGLPVRFDKGENPGRVMSYRGDYSQLAITCDGKDACRVEDLLGRLRDAVGKTFEGYKGGYYAMGLHTLVFAANWGECTGRFPVAVFNRVDVVVIFTKCEEQPE